MRVELRNNLRNLYRKVFWPASRRIITKNKKISTDDVVSCQKNIDALFRFAPTEQTTEERIWGTREASCHAAEFKKNFRVTPNFLGSLRTYTQCFTGHQIEPGRESELLWFDAFAPQTKEIDWSIAAYQRYSEIPYKCVPPMICGEVGYDLKGVCVNRDVSAVQERIFLLHYFKMLGKQRIVEIGAGFGLLAYQITRFSPETAYVIVDLPASLVFSICYLTVAGRRVVVTPRIGKLEPGTIYLTTPDAVEDWTQKFDLGINTMSFAEMPHATVSRYGAFIKRHAGILFEQNFSFPDHDQNHYCDPKAVLAKVFDHSEPYHGETIYGQACLWS